MERHKKDKKRRQKVPRVPIETYRWEDLRRSRLRGGYPWTYLYKDPFDEELDPSHYTMEEMSKSKSSSTLTKSNDGVDILEVTNGIDSLSKTSQENFMDPSSYIVITEVPSDSENHSRDEPRGSFTIEEEHLESESSDNISQYLDKEEAEQPIPTPEPSTSLKAENGRTERAKSEEPKRKRKQSIESSYSRKSLSKLAILKKIKEAKEKIKMPHFSLPSIFKGNEEKKDDAKSHDAEKEPEVKQQPKQKTVQGKSHEKPVYIHIPLKPPSGETDEFSYLEFEEKREPKPEEVKPVADSEVIEAVEDKPEEKEVTPRTLTPEVPIQRTSSLSNLDYDRRRFSGHPDEIVAIEILKSEPIDLHENGIHGVDDDIFIVQQDPNDTHKDDVIIILSGDEEPSPNKSREATPKLSRQSTKRKDRAKSAEPERKRKLSLESSYSGRSLSKQGIIKKLKEAKEKILPIFSLSRSNSKKESSKKSKSETELNKEEKKETKKLEVKSKKDEPKYIHIPLKPPPGESDEFSHLEFEEKKQEEPVKTEVKTNKEDQGSLESPASVQTDDVHFIFLTPPSDDEILDSRSDVPETPSSDAEFFESRVDELKKIAQGAVDKVSPESKKKLHTVTEEPKEATEISETKPEIDTENLAKTESEEVKEQSEKMVIDEEDGLKLTESAMAKQEQNIKAKEVKELPKSSLKTDGSPVLKKKVSFKRRSRDDGKDGIYEDIQAPDSGKVEEKQNLTDEQKNKLAVLENSQSMSVDEEKSYLDEKIIKSTSLEEDYNRWSKMSDHEYEPINPPPDNASPLVTLPQAQVIEGDQGPRQKPTSQGSSTTSLDRRMLGGEPESPPPEPYTAEEIQNEIEERFFTAPKAAQPPKSESTVQETQAVPPLEESTPPKTQEMEPPRKGGPGKFQQAIKAQAGKFKTKLHNMKRPSLTLPSKPNLQKLKFEKPKFNLPKMPDTTKISLPTFSLPRRNPTKRSLKQRQFSTESNAGDSKKKYFDFSTYPRIFKKKPKNNDFDSSSSKNEQEIPEFATVPRTKKNQKDDRNPKETDKWGGRDTIRIPLRPEESLEENSREDSVERRMASHIRYDEDIDTDDAFEKENQEIHKVSPFSNDYNSRWNHGSFHPEPTLEFTENLRNREYKVTDLDSPEEEPVPQDSFDTNTSKDVNSSESSLGIHRRGVLEEIDSDEFFLRQKGISQDNIEVGMYLSSEIREAFKSPINALSALQRDPNFEVRGSNQSLPETPTKRKPMKKPKRKKTPHVSQEQISFDQEDSEPEQFLGNLPPARPRRRSKRNKKSKDQENVVPYQETIALDEPVKEDMGILARSDDEAPRFTTMYENERMEGKEHPEIRVSDPYTDFKYYEDRYESDEEQFQDETPKPEAPPRRNRSLNFSEHDSIMGDLNLEMEIPQENVEVYKTTREYTASGNEERPMKPTRNRSRSRSRDKEISEYGNEEADETPLRPTRTRSRSGTRSQPDDDRTSRGADSLTSEPQPCIEEPCVQDFRDYMGYAVIDKNQKREPPLPPPRTPPRRKRSTETRFFTVPRPLNDAPPPVRPLRNYSTLGPCRPPRRKHVPNMTDEEKVDITQYIEIEEEPNRDLHSGEVIQKMRDRPLPAPPRPPRKTRNFQDDEVEGSQQDINDSESGIPEETEVSTQTEALPDDFPFEEIEEQEISVTREHKTESEPETIKVERRLITPTHYSFEETVTHGSLVVEPLNGAKILPDSEITRRETPVERNIPVTKEYDDFVTSEIPDDFKKLKDPGPNQISGSPQPQIIERIIERPVGILPDSNTEVEVLKAHKLQVTDLDVDRLNVNELMANRIIVSEIDSGNIQANEISSKTGALKIGEIELPPSVVQQLFERLQSVALEQQSSSRGPTDEKPVAEPPVKEVESTNPGQKKTPIEPLELENIPQRPPRKSEESPEPTVDLVEEENQIDNAPTKQTHSLNFFDDTCDGDQEKKISTEPHSISFVDKEGGDGDQRQETGTPPEPPVRSDSSVKIKSREFIEEEKLLTETVELSSHIEETTEAPLLQKISSQTPKDLDSVDAIEESPPQRPPRQADKIKSDESEKEEPMRIEEPEVDDEPPPRPPQPPVDYLASQPPASFYALRAQEYVENLDDDIPMVPRRRRHHKPRVSRSSSDESPAPPPVRRRFRSPEPTIPQLAGQLIQACGSAANSSIKRLIAHITNNVLGNADGNQDLHVVIIILLVLIAGLILLGYGDEKTVHYHHWEYFNPPRDM